MRIVDKERDYYDIGQGLGYEASVTYVRQRQEVDLKASFDASDIRGHSVGANFIVGFCGNLYQGTRADPSGWHHSNETDSVCYKLADLDRYVEGKFGKKDIAAYYAGERGHDYYLPNRDAYKRWFEQLSTPDATGRQDPPSRLLDYFRDYNTPIFVIDTYHWKANSASSLIVNAILRPYVFQKIKEPYTAYQEIEQYVGGVLNADPMPMPEVPDDTMRDIKGFDQWSFRKEPQGGKKGRRSKR